MVSYDARNIAPDMSFLEMLDVVNQELVEKGEEPIAFDSDCREGICGRCSLVIDGVPHGPDRPPALHKEPLTFEAVKPTVRSYK